jgi:hypothetical protein
LSNIICTQTFEIKILLKTWSYHRIKSALETQKRKTNFGLNPLAAIEVSYLTVFTFLKLMSKPNWKSIFFKCNALESHSKFSINQMDEYLWEDITNAGMRSEHANGPKLWKDKH